MRPQVTALILSPSFPGWTAPLRFSPVRFAELVSFAGTLCGAWVLASLLAGGYRTHATSGAPRSPHTRSAPAALPSHMRNVICVRRLPPLAIRLSLAC